MTPDWLVAHTPRNVGVEDEDEDDEDEADEDEEDDDADVAGDEGGFAGRARAETVDVVAEGERGRGGGVRQPVSRASAPVT